MIIRESDSIVFYSEKEQIWRNKKGQLHRKVGPAMIFSDGSQYWYYKGQRHRKVDQPL